MSEVVAVYAGSFDPMTFGHVDVVKRAARLFERVVVAVGVHPTRQPLFSVEERLGLLDAVVGQEPNVEVDSFSGLLIDYCVKREARVLVRGLRISMDFEYELQMANMNRHLNEQVVTVFIMANDAYFYVSSNIVKEAAKLGGDISRLVPDSVGSRLKAKLGQ